MASKVKGASYLKHHDDASSHGTVNSQKRPVAVVLSSIMAVFMLLLVVAPLIGNHFTQDQRQGVQANAFFEIFCNATIGNGMDDNRQLKTNGRSFPHADARNRDWTLQEAYGDGVRLVNFQGLGEGTKWTTAKEAPEGSHIPAALSSSMDTMESVRNGPDCFIGGISSGVSSAIFNTANFATMFTQFFVLFAFDTEMICSEPGQDGACIDLLGIIGGEDDDDNSGLISILTNSIYMPLMLIVVALGAIAVVYHGLVKRKLREALGKAIWVVLAALAGVLILAFPSGVSQAPMLVTNSLASCIIGSFNGDNCFTNSSNDSSIDFEDGDSTSNNICSSSAAGLSANEQMSMTINTLNCNIWKAFVLEPYSNASFGMSFAELDTKDDSNAELQQLIADTDGVTEDTFCVNLRSAQSVSDMAGNTMEMGEAQADDVCNLAAFQMFLSHDAQNADDDYTPGAGASDERWYQLATLVAQDEGLWNEWTVGFNSGMQKIGLGLMSIFAAILGGFVMVVISFYAMIFKLSAIILTAMAPLFLLFMIEPTRGKKIAGGWFGQILSSIMKYLASALFLLVTIVLYGAVLGGAGSNMFATIIFIIILTGALLMYRREIVDLIGQVDMGTKVFSNKIGERFSGQAKLAGSVAAGAVGAKLGGSTIMAGAKDTFQRDMARGMGKEAFGGAAGSFAQGTARQYNRATVAQTQKLRQNVTAKQGEHNMTATALGGVQEQYDKAQVELQNFDNTNHDEAKEFRVLHNMETQDAEVRSDAQDQISQLSPDFGEAMRIMDEIKNLQIQAQVAIDTGDTDAARALSAQITDLDEEGKGLMAGVPAKDRRVLHEEYQNMIRDGRRANGMENYSVEDQQRFQQLAASQQIAGDRRQTMVDKLDDLSKEGKELEFQEAEAGAAARSYNEQYEKLQPGENITGGKRKIVDHLAELSGAEAQSKIQSNFDEHNDLVSNPTLPQVSNDRLPPIDPSGGDGTDGGDDNVSGDDPNSSGGGDRQPTPPPVPNPPPERPRPQDRTADPSSPSDISGMFGNDQPFTTPEDVRQADQATADQKRQTDLDGNSATDTNFMNNEESFVEDKVSPQRNGGGGLPTSPPRDQMPNQSAGDKQRGNTGGGNQVRNVSNDQGTPAARPAQDKPAEQPAEKAPEKPAAPKTTQSSGAAPSGGKPSERNPGGTTTRRKGGGGRRSGGIPTAPATNGGNSGVANKFDAVTQAVQNDAADAMNAIPQGQRDEIGSLLDDNSGVSDQEFLDRTSGLQDESIQDLRDNVQQRMRFRNQMD